MRIRGSRWYALPWHYLLLAAWAARWFQVFAAGGGASWHLFTEAGRLLYGGHPAGFGAPGGLRLFASYPRFQFGPVTLVIAAALRLLGPDQGLVVAQLLMTGCGLAILVVAERTARAARPDLDPDQIRWTVLGAGLVFWPVCEILAVSFMHLDDVLALLFAVLAAGALVRGRVAAVGVLLALSAGSKPWAFGFMALLLALPGKDARLRGLAWAAGVTAVTWLPFVIADPGSVAAARYAIPNVAVSGLRALGVDSANTPPWDRAAQILVGLGLAAIAVRRGRWPAVLLICTAVRLALDPNYFPYYNAGPVVGALIWDLMGARRATPAWTLAAGSLFWGWTAVPGRDAMLSGDLRVGFAAAVAAYTIIAPAYGFGERRGSDHIGLLTVTISPSHGGIDMHDGWSRRGFVRCCLTIAGAGAGSAALATGADAKPRKLTTALHYESRPDLSPPRIEITRTGTGGSAEAASPGRQFFLLTTEGSTGQHGPLMLDGDGEVVWFRPVASGGLAKNLNVQTYRGKPALTWWESGRTGSDVTIGEGTGYIADARYDIVAKVRAGHGLRMDFHEFNLTERGTALITAYRPRVCDLRRLGGARRGWAFGAVAQEIDVATGEVIFEWDSLDHVPLTETMHRFYPGTRRRPFDYFHINSIGVASDGNLLISGRNTCAVYKVNRKTGAVIWRLGGRRSSFTMGPGARFWWQHHVREHAPDLLSIFDDGADPARERQSRGILLDVDTRARRATLRRAFTNSRRELAVNQGSMQVLPDGGVLIGWGSEPVFSEFTASGKQVLTGQMPHGDWSYRAFAADWTGAPGGRPAVAARRASHGGTVVYMSWNGATGVAGWVVYAGSAAALEPVAAQRSGGFETAIFVPGDRPCYSAAALDASGRVLGRSGTVRRG